MLDLAKSIDAASVVVPTDLHHSVALALMEHGVHLLVEKPIAATTAEAEEMVAVSRRKGVILQVGHVERFNPVLSVLEAAATKPRFIEAHRLAPYPPPREGLHPRGTEVSVVLDLMIHDLEVILHLVRSKVVDVRAVGIPVLSPSEDIANVRLLFENGCVANVTASRISPEKMRKIRVFLDDAYLSLDYQSQSGELHRKTRTGIVREEIPIEKGEPLANELASFIGCVSRRDAPVVSGEHAAGALQLAVQIIQRMREGAS
jgi:predicted dehydrogenase